MLAGWLAGWCVGGLVGVVGRLDCWCVGCVYIAIDVVLMQLLGVKMCLVLTLSGTLQTRRLEGLASP